MTKSAALIVLAISIFSVAASQLLIKARLTNPGFAEFRSSNMFEIVWRCVSDFQIMVGLFLVGLGGICWYASMMRLPLSFMLPVAGIIAPLVSLGAYFFLNEPLTLAKIAAITVIAVSVMWLGWLNA